MHVERLLQLTVSTRVLAKGVDGEHPDQGECHAAGQEANVNVADQNAIASLSKVRDNMYVARCS